MEFPGFAGGDGAAVVSGAGAVVGGAVVAGTVVAGAVVVGAATAGAWVVVVTGAGGAEVDGTTVDTV